MQNDVKMMSTHPFRPGDGRDGVVVGGQVTEPGDLAGAGRPQVDAGPEAHTQHVLAGPVDEIQIEVVLELGGVQDLEGDLGDLARGLARGAQKLLGFRRDRGQAVGGRGLVHDVASFRAVLEIGKDIQLGCGMVAYFPQ